MLRNDIACARNIPGMKSNLTQLETANTTAPAKARASDCFKALQHALRDHKAAQTTHDEGFFERANARAEKALDLKCRTTVEHAAKLKLVLATDGEGVDPIVLRILRELSSHLDTVVAA